MDIDGGSSNNNGKIIQWTCSGAGNQIFQLNQVATGVYRLIATHSGKCVDVTSGSTADGAKLIQYTCGSGSNQRWSLPGHP